MPSTIIPASRATNSVNPTSTFTGTVWMDPIHIAPGIKINNVFFQPCARTHWHTHEGGQLLRVLAGSGWICDRGGEPRRLHVGDTVWAEPGTEHWHGGDDGSFMLHLAVSHGETRWGAKV